MILCYFNRFDLSIIAQEKLLDMIRLFLPLSNNLPKTINKLKKLTLKENDEILENYYCDVCLNRLDNEKKCCEEECVNHNKKLTNVCSFTYLNIEPRITKLIKNNFDKIMEFRTTKECFLDLNDGEHYKNIKNQNQLTLMVYTDGISVSNSSSNHFWPVIIGLCELPSTLRDSLKNKIVNGVWFGNKKPTSDNLFKSLKEELELININGIKIQKNNTSYVFYLKIYGIICDAPAKAMVLNMNQFNGYFGCAYCLNPGNLKYKF